MGGERGRGGTNIPPTCAHNENADDKGCAAKIPPNQNAKKLSLKWGVLLHPHH